MNQRHVTAFVSSCFLLAGAAVGCSRQAAGVAQGPETPAVPVSAPVQREVTDYVDFTGQTYAVDSVTIVPRVTGYLLSTHFDEGAEVKKDQLLFQIDPSTYQAQYDQAAAQVSLNEARVREAKADNARAQQLAKTPGAISQQDLDRYVAAEEEAIASVVASKASLEAFKLNLGFCQVTSPIDGKASRYFLTPGNLVNQDQTQLTTVVSLDPMYVYFDLDTTTLLRIRQAVNEGRVQRYDTGQIPVYIGLETETGYEHQGMINFVDNQVNASTGSIPLRGSIPNPLPPKGTRLLSPGMFVRVRLPIGKPHSALLIVDRAIGSDQGLKYVFVLNKDNVVEQRRVQTGPLQEDGLRVINAGVRKDDRVVIGAIQQVRPKMTVVPDPQPMPTLGPVSGAGLSDSSSQPAEGEFGTPQPSKSPDGKKPGAKSPKSKAPDDAPPSAKSPDAKPPDSKSPDASGTRSP